MLQVYSADWCSHCQRTIAFLKKNNIEINVIDIETQPKDVVDKIIEVNGGFDWVVPTLEYNGNWRPGKVYDPDTLKRDLIEMGVTGLE